MTTVAVAYGLVLGVGYNPRTALTAAGYADMPLATYKATSKLIAAMMEGHFDCALITSSGEMGTPAEAETINSNGTLWP